MNAGYGRLNVVSWQVDSPRVTDGVTGAVQAWVKVFTA